ncbi:hypothetical protein [Peribacillus simplex]|uniref:hypothetical protein n=1 Tax=Peribacillus simplex TaxID=1478 RepID=UPI00366B1C31
MLQLSIIILMLGVFITLNLNLWIKISGIAIFTFGFFASHSIASSWVGRLAAQKKAQAASLYLFSYYFGGSIVGTASGTFYSNFGWIGIVVMIAVLSTISLLISIRLGTISSRTIKLLKIQ